MDPISSTQNQQIKDLLKLSKARERKTRGLFIIEGIREIKRAQENDYIFQKVFYCKSLISIPTELFLDKIHALQKIEVSQNVFSRIAYRDNSDGVLVLAESKANGLAKLVPKGNGLYLVVERVEKPGNLGALLRTADAAGVDAVIVCDSNTDLYNPNVIRSSLGCLFTKTVILADSISTIKFLKRNKVNIFAAALQNSELYSEADYTHSSAFIMGSEADGLSENWREAADKIIAIPMNGDVDSLNVSVSAAILIYEAIRQRS